MLRVHGAPIMVVGEVAELTVVSIRSSNVRPHVQAMADGATLIYSQLAQPTGPPCNLESVIGATSTRLRTAGQSLCSGLSGAGES